MNLCGRWTTGNGTILASFYHIYLSIFLLMVCRDLTDACPFHYLIVTGVLRTKRHSPQPRRVIKRTRDETYALWFQRTLRRFGRTVYSG